MTNKKWTYQTVRNSFSNKVKSYRTLITQTTGGTGKYRPTPTQLNSFSKWIDKGAIVHNVTSTQLNRWAKSQKNWTVTSAKNYLYQRYGKNYIKAVTWNKTGGFLVATSPMRYNKPIKFTKY